MAHPLLHLHLHLLGLVALAGATAPCDIFAAAGNTPCVAAHSVVRALFSKYDGPLYTVQRADTNATLDIAVLAPGGYANTTAHDTFCNGAACVISRIWDQSSKGNHLQIEGPGTHGNQCKGVNASAHPVKVGGHAVYGAFFEGGMGYRNDNTSGIAIGNQPETLYMVTSGHHTNAGCCFDYGNAETDPFAMPQRPGTMECIYVGTNCDHHHGCGTGNGPWVQADLERAIWGGNNGSNPKNTGISAEFVTAFLKGGTNGFALKHADASMGDLTVLYDGPRPHGYQPMQKQGGLVLGTGGDDSNGGTGIFYEGVVTSGYTTEAADAAVQANIVAVGYGKSSRGPGRESSRK
jgi:non-reducing end alpha-L-arabinofuranosidase